MYLIITGNFEEEKMLKVILSELKDSNPVKVERKTFVEPNKVVKNFSKINLPIILPSFCFGFKLKPFKREEILKADIAYGIIFELLVGRASRLFSKFKDGNFLLKNELSYGSVSGQGFYSLVVSGESRNYEFIFNEIKKEIEFRQQNGFEKENFEAEKKAIYGETVSQFENSLAFIIFDMMFFSGGPYDILEIIANLTFEEINHYLSLIDVKNVTLSVGVPK